jgi:hypothetical protein
MENGFLLSRAEEASFDVFLTADKNFRYQQSLSQGRKIALVVLGNSPWHLVRLRITEIVAAINTATPGSYVEVEISLPPKPPFVRSGGDPSLSLSVGQDQNMLQFEKVAKLSVFFRR